MQLVPSGYLIIAHKGVQRQGLWAHYGIKVYFLGPVRNCYQCYNVYIQATRGQQIIDTIEFFPMYIQIPKTSWEDCLVSIIEDLIAVL